MPMLNHMYPGNFAAFYSATTWTRSSAAYLAATGSLPPPVPVPLPLEYSQALAASLAQAGHPMAYPLTVPMPLNLATDYTKKKPAKSPNNTITKFTIDEILGNGSKEDDDSDNEEEEIEIESIDDGEKETMSSGHSPRGPGDRLSPAPGGTGTPSAGDLPEDPNARFSWLQCTRYKPPKLPRVKRKDGVKKRKLGRNPRVPFTQHQVSTLEQKFQRTHYLSSVDVAELSAALNLTETRVKIWFQNRRARERRDREQRQQQGQPGGSAGPTSPGHSTSAPRSLLPPAPNTPTSAAILRPFQWPLPTPPTPSALAHFSHALQQHGPSAFTPVTFPTYTVDSSAKSREQFRLDY